ncbi:MAG: hypothetical protein L0226_10745 [Acidobacteria bacterium]|nr:hypothetical protein [Acidobacteriota bacterium]
MSLSLRIYQAKPNPAGKAKTTGGLSKPELLLGEWVDIENDGTELIAFSKIQLHHSLFNELCQTRGQTEQYWRAEGKGLLKPGQLLRVHTGRHQDKSLMSTIDEEDVDWHAYAERDDFVLNNRCGDIVVVTWIDEDGREYKDAASYAPHPPEGVILKRSDNQLVHEVLADG